jgi:hypothetical protein
MRNQSSSLKTIPQITNQPSVPNYAHQGNSLEDALHTIYRDVFEEDSSSLYVDPETQEVLSSEEYWERLKYRSQPGYIVGKLLRQGIEGAINLVSRAFEAGSQTKASDHNPIVKGNFCTFNLLNRCEFKTPADTNNGFKINESASEYRERLIHRVLPMIEKLIQKDQVKIFSFQEAPSLTLSPNADKDEKATFEAAQEFYKKLRELFPQYKIESKHYKGIGKGLNTSGLLFVYHDAYKVKDLTQEMASSISEMNRERFQAFELIDNTCDSSKITRFANFHANFNNQEGTAKDIQLLASQGYIVMGDFNLITFPPTESCAQRIQTTEPGMMPFDTYDGIVDCEDPSRVYPRI